MSRIRPGRLRTQSVESALGNYIRSVLRDNRRLESSQTITAQATADAAEIHISDEFQRFLETLQSDLVGAVRAFAGTPIATQPVPSAVVSEISEPTEAASPEPEAIPTFHAQLGQNLPSNNTQTTTGVTGGSDGSPRRLNFFRAHTFPELGQAAGNDGFDPDAIVPCIFIAVRSISHDPAMTTEDLVQHPNFPFADGQVPSTETPENDAGSTTSASSGSRTIRQRIIDRFSRPTTRPDGPLNTYLVSVIGGNYPRSHPVLAIPNLLTGGPLTDEEMQLVVELMGPAKPPTATPEQIEQAGLKIVDGSNMKDLGSSGEMLESCVDRCLVSLT